MYGTPLYKKPWFYFVAWLAGLLFVYGWQVLRLGGIGLGDILVDLVIIFPALLLLWMAFFAQFVLPVRTLGDRQKIFNRLLAILTGGHGPAMFIRDGVLIKREGEELKKGPGVLWLDSASGAVTRSAVAVKQTLGPGVHFIENGEYIAGTVDLHIQSQGIGPTNKDKPFDDKNDEQTPEEYAQVQDRRKQVSALTRDGIEVIPNISVSFRIDTGFPKEGKPGSRFGYRTGNTPKDKQHEAQDKEAIRRAILGEGINPNAPAGSRLHRIAWNQLPALLAVDVWREYTAKFTLDELFKADQIVPPPPAPVQQPTEEEIDLLSQPIRVGANRESMQDGMAEMLRVLNRWMYRIIGWLEGTKEDKAKKAALHAPAPQPTAPPRQHEPQKKTALQVINEMVKARLTQPEVDILDNHGVRGEGTIPSAEYKLLQERGLKVLSVGISNPRVNPEIEDIIIRRWSAAWFNIANAEKDQIERRKNIMETSGRDKAMRQYADWLSHDLIQKKPAGVQKTLKTLLMRTRTIIINNDQLRKNMADEQQELEDIIKWIEVNGG